MRIGQLTNAYWPVISGVTTLVSLHKRVLESRGHTVFVFTLGHENCEDDDPSVVRSPGIPLFDTGYRFSFRFSRRALRKMQSMDVLHAHQPFISGRQAVCLGRRHGIPVVLSIHTRYHVQAGYYAPFVPPGLSRAFVGIYLSRLCPRCDLVVVTSRGTERVLRELGVTCPLEFIPNGVDLARWQRPAAPLSKRDLGLPERATVAVTVGRLGPEKNLPFLLTAFARAANGTPDLHLVLVGGGLEEAQLRDLARSLGVSARVHWAGEVPYEQMPNWLALADFFAFASTNEGHPLAVLEALAAGLPVLAIPGPGVEDVLVDGLNGLSSPEDMDVFAARMRRLAEHPDLRARLAAGARQTSARYDVHRTVATLLGHYQRLVEKRARGGLP